MSKRPEAYRLADVSAHDTARMIRIALKREFPKLPARFFSVRSDHNSIRVSWTDGPTAAEVDAIVKRFAGASFDGMTDSTNYLDAVLTEQDVFDLRGLGASKAGLKYFRVSEKEAGDQYAKNVDTDPLDNPAYYLAGAGGDLVRWGAKYVFTTRTESPDLLAIVAERIGARFGVWLKLAFSDPASGGRVAAHFESTQERLSQGAHETATDEGHRIARATPWRGDNTWKMVVGVIAERYGSPCQAEQEEAEIRELKVIA